MHLRELVAYRAKSSGKRGRIYTRIDANQLQKIFTTKKITIERIVPFDAQRARLDGRTIERQKLRRIGVGRLLVKEKQKE